jgi:hypothetical protein
MSNHFENRDPPASTGITPIHRSGTFAPQPSGPHADGRAGGEIKPGNHVPPSQGGK